MSTINDIFGPACPTGPAANEACGNVHYGYSVLGACINRNMTVAQRVAMNPLTGRADWGCQNLFINTPPINMNNVDGIGLVVTMGWCAAAVAFFAMIIFMVQVLKSPIGKEGMVNISLAIQAGAKAFLHQEFAAIGVFAIVMFAAMCGYLYNSVEVPCNVLNGQLKDCNQFIGHQSLKTLGVFTGLSFLTGGLCSAMAGYLGMWVATRANVRTCFACDKSINGGLRVAFKSGAVMGLAVVALGLMGLQICWLVLSIGTVDQRLVWQYLSGFGFGGSMIAIFARVAGGIYTKAADVGSDLVGKVEAGIPEDSPNNPGVIADNVGDNVGDVAGMGADLLESYIGALIAACTLGYEAYSGLSFTTEQLCCTYGVAIAPPFLLVTNYALNAIAYPFWLAGVGILSSIMGIYIVRTGEMDEKSNEAALDALLWSIRYGVFFASAMYAGFAALISWAVMGNSGTEWRLYGTVLIGLFSGLVTGMWTEFCTSYGNSPVQSIAKKSTTGPATVIIQGMGVGMIATSVPLIMLVGTIIACNALASNYGIAIAACSMLNTLGITLATDAYGPVADNAGGIAEMAGNEVTPQCRQRTDYLDAMGNTTAATGKGYAIASAALTSVALIQAFVAAAGLTNVGIDDPVVLAGVFLGAMFTFVFAALTMLSVGRAAEEIIFEVRRQFEAEPNLKIEGWKPPPGSKYPDPSECVKIATRAALWEMITPACLAIFSPFVTGYMLGARCLVGMLVGNLTSGICLAITMATAGGAWDNAKKWVEKDGLDKVNKTRGKKTPFHAAVVVGDTVGDPFKDTSGPALNIYIKMTALLSIVLAPSFKVANPTGEVFPTGTWWIGLVIFVIVFLLILIWNGRMMERYSQNAKKLEEASRKFQEQRAAAGAGGATTTTAPAATTTTTTPTTTTPPATGAAPAVDTTALQGT